MSETERKLKEFEKAKSDFAEKQKQLTEQRKQLAVDQQTLAAQRAQFLEQSQSGGAARGQVQQIVTARIGDLREFDVREDWSLWKERLDQFLLVNDIPEAKKVPLLITLLGSEGYALLRNICTPEIPSSKNFKQLTDAMTNHLQPKPSVISERFKFKQCRQGVGEDTKTFLTNLKRLSTYCEFGTNLETNLRDQFVWGLRDVSSQKRLLGEKDLSCSRAIELAQLLESASRDAAEMGTAQKSEEESINFVASRKPGQTSRRGSGNGNYRCFCCGKPNHLASVCRYRQYKCNICKTEGHLAQVCKVNKQISSSHGNEGQRNNNRNNFVGETANDCGDVDDLFHLHGEVNGNYEQSTEAIFSISPIKVKLLIEGIEVECDVDTGSDVAAISEKFFEKQVKFQAIPLGKTSRIFKSHPGQVIVPLGVINVGVEYGNKFAELELFVLPGDGPPLMGRTWICALAVPVSELLEGEEKSGINWVNSSSQSDIDGIINEFDDVFSDSLGKYSKRKFQIHLKENATPVFCKPRPIPYAMREKVETELNRLLEIGVIEPVENSDWATPIVPVFKSNGQIRLCGDYKVTVNPHIKIDRYPIPRVQDLLASLNGGTVFSKIDLSHAYLQVGLEDESRMLTTVSTHKGLFAYNRLCFGIASAPGLFQREMEQVLNGLEGVVCFFDDILISGPTRAIHNERLRAVLSRLKDCGLTVKKDKCQCGKDSVEFLGYLLNSQGIHVSKEKVKAIVDAPAPSDLSQLRAFLGMLNYYSRFIRNYSKVVNPLYRLLQKDTAWNWDNTCDEAFRAAKRSLIESEVLAHYDLSLPVKIACDASPFGLGAVLSHVYSNGSERPIAFASRTLSKAEKGYSQLDKEALGLIFGVKKFHQFVYGRRFILETDHKPLVYIFGSKQGLPQMSANRVQRWAVLLSAYDYEIKYIKGVDNARADGLSRVPLPCNNASTETTEKEYSYFNFVSDEIESIDAITISDETKADLILSRVREFVLNGWPEVIEDELKPYKNREKELSVEEGCVMWGHRVVIPTELRASLLNELHSIHMGVVRMKAVARSYLWWPGLDSDIEKVTKLCELCLKSADNPPRASLHSWKWPEGPSHRLHADFLGPVEGRMFLIIIDSFSKWIDVKEMNDITSESTVKAFREYMCTWGIPLTLVTDNGPSFCSKEFRDFLISCGVRHVRTAPYHPASNGAAENAVRSFKNKYKLLLKAGYSRHEALCKFLFYYRATPHCTTNCSPAELQIGRKFRTKLDFLHPTVRHSVEQKQKNQQQFFRGNRKIVFEVNEIVMAKDYSCDAWRKSRVLEQLSPVTYNVITSDGRTWKRHKDQLIRCNLDASDGMIVDTAKNVIANSANEYQAFGDASVQSVSDARQSNEVVAQQSVVSNSASAPFNATSVPPLRRSSRVIKPRQILDL